MNWIILRHLAPWLLLILALERSEASNPLLPKRLIASIGSKVNLQFSDNEIENAFTLGREMVSRNMQLEDDLVREGRFTPKGKNSPYQTIHYCGLNVFRFAMENEISTDFYCDHTRLASKAIFTESYWQSASYCSASDVIRKIEQGD